MSETLTYQRAAAPARDQAHTLFAQTIGYVAATAALFALGAYLGRHLPGGAGIAGFIACGAAGYATRRDLTPVARAGFWAPLVLIVFGIVLIFASIPAGALIYLVLGLVIFAGFTLFDFQRIRLSRDINSALLLAASSFLDILNVFLFSLQIFSREQQVIMLPYRRVIALTVPLTPHPSGPAPS